MIDGQIDDVGRGRPAADTVAIMQSRLADFGITRVAKQTNLDNLGLPVYAGIRPNAKNLSSSQGKGLSEAAAMASAIMEAVEFATAEQPACQTVFGTFNDIRGMGFGAIDPTYLMPLDSAWDAQTSAMSWFLGFGLVSGQSYCVPADAVRIDGMAPDLPGVCQTTNGLASGNNTEEAVLHGLCELIERDAATLWALRPPNAIEETSLDVSSFKDRRLDALASKFAGSGLKLRLFDQTTDLGVPCIMAMLGSERGSSRKFSFAAGYGAHPSAAQAALRAVTEAAQTRVTSIASSRDDIGPDEFEQQIATPAKSLLQMRGLAGAPVNLCASREASQLLNSVTEALTRRKIAEPVAVQLSPRDDDYAVVRVLSPELEDASANINWRPRARALATIEHYENTLRWA